MLFWCNFKNPGSISGFYSKVLCPIIRNCDFGRCGNSLVSGLERMGLGGQINNQIAAHTGRSNASVKFTLNRVTTSRNKSQTVPIACF